MASMKVSGLLLVFSSFIIHTTSTSAKDGFILTVPQILRYGTDSEFCVTIQGTESKTLDINLISPKDGLSKVKVYQLYTPGKQMCTSFKVPKPGEYELVLSNDTDVIHDVVEITVLEGKPITLVQTDKPMYKPGQVVKFRIMTLLTDLKPRMGKINSVFIIDPNRIRVKQFLDVQTKGLTSLKFQLSSEAKLGDWKIEVMMMDDPKIPVKPISTNFEVKEYVLPRFEVIVNPPPFVLRDAEIIEGSVCAKYTYGKMVQGFLDLEICWGYYHGGSDGFCEHEVVEINGCYNWTANMTQMTSGNTYMRYYSELQVKATVTELGTGVTVNKSHSGPRTTNERIKISITDYTNGYFKPRLPYIGKVTVTNPDGTPAVGEEIKVTARDYKNNLRFSSTFITDDTGIFAYSLCDSFTEKTTSISITAEGNRYKDSNWTGPGLNKPTAYSTVNQWFSPSLSYIQIPRSDLNLKCGDRFTHGIPFTTRAGKDVNFTYQVKARGQIVKTGQVKHDASAGFPGFETVQPSKKTCLQEEIITTLPPKSTSMAPPSPPPPFDPSNPLAPLEKIELIEVELDEDSSDDEPQPLIPLEDGENEPDVPPPPPGAEDSEPMPEVPANIPPPIDEFQEPIIRPEQLSDKVSTFLLDMEISTKMAPRFTLLVYHVMEDGEVVADSMEFEVEPCFSNDVQMKFNKSSALPGEKVAINLKAAPGSVCGVGVVDKSINLLGGNHQVTKETVFKRLEELSKTQYFSLPPMFRDNDYCEKRMKKILVDQGYDESEEYTYWHYSSSYVDALEAFKAGGFIVVTNLNLETRPCGRSFPVYFYDMEALDSVPAPSGSIPVALRGMRGPTMARNEGISKSNPKTVRTNFPETWLWDLVLVGDSGESMDTKVAPDTITNWVGNAMCVEKSAGFGVSPMTNLITFQPFFLSLNLPYAAVRGERLPVILTVYNYLEKCLNIQWSLNGGENFQIQYKGANSVCVCGGKSHSATFYVTPKGIGKLDIMAKAEVIPGLCGNAIETETGYEGYSDAVRRKMLVKAEGVTQEYTSTVYMCSKTGQPKMEDVILPLPEKIVNDSARGELRVIGDIMGPALSNLDNLVRIPTGCGEQNMVGFVPNILVMKYLIGTGRLTEEIEDKAISYMEVGYQRELNYRHPDGSFSAFGPRDEAGSVWLTAFVVKSFAMAKGWIYIDEKDMNLSISFLKKSQLENGCFRETGKVFSSYMMGGLAKGKNKDEFKALTAYVLIALLHAKVNKSESVIEDAVECLNRDFKKTKNKMDPYTLALVAYANTLYMPYSHVATDIMRHLGKKSKKDGSFRFWRRDGAQAKPVNTWYYYAAPSAEVEMTSYALLAYLNFYKEKSISQTYDIAMWISQQRSPRGGFASTQDTVVGLNALANFAELTFDAANPPELNVGFSSRDKIQSMNVSESLKNTLLLQTAPIPTLPNRMSIKVEGTGCALVMANVQYNKMPQNLEGESKPNFYLRINPRSYEHDEDRCDRKTLIITVGARGGAKFATGMTLVVLKMVTSWYPVEDSLTKLRSQFPVLGMKRYEHDEEEGTLTFYFDELSRKPKQFTIHVEQDQDLRVSNPKPAEIKVFQYYETDVSMIKSYKLKTICGTKAEIPRKPIISPWLPGAPVVQRRVPIMLTVVEDIDMEELIPVNDTSASVCPICLTEKKFIPPNLKDLVCKSTAIYKAITGRAGARPIKLRANIRPDEIQKDINIFAKFKMNEQCNCSLLTPPTSRVLMFINEPMEKKTLKLNEDSFIIVSHRKLEKAVRKFQSKCDKKMETP